MASQFVIIAVSCPSSEVVESLDDPCTTLNLHGLSYSESHNHQIWGNGILDNLVACARTFWLWFVFVARMVKVMSALVRWPGELSQLKSD